MSAVHLLNPESKSYNYVVPSMSEIPPHITVALDIDLEAIVHNYRQTQSILAPHCAIAGVVKADAYGLGMKAVATTLWRQGCHQFFVAFIEEGMKLRAVLPHASIYVLSGVLPQTEEIFLKDRLTPVLVDQCQVKRWQTYAQRQSITLSAVLHVDTGMSRNGLTLQEVRDLTDDPTSFQGLHLDFVMSHLASSENLDTDQNHRQQILFEQVRRILPSAKASLSNSSGLSLGHSYNYDLVRPGIGLLGYARPYPLAEQLRPAVKAMARVVQRHESIEGQTIGYNATYRCVRPSKLATLGTGYRDGFFWNLSSRGVVWFGDYKAPVVGRVSMDFVVVDVTEIPESLVHVGAWATLFDTYEKAQYLSQQAGSFHYELLTSLGSRYYRRYLKEKDTA
ncbi:MAG: alanine racemase [Janthinobacterium lividum]